MSQELFSTDEMGDSRPLKRSRHFNLPDDHDAALLCDDNFGMDDFDDKHHCKFNG